MSRQKYKIEAEQDSRAGCSRAFARPHQDRGTARGSSVEVRRAVDMLSREQVADMTVRTVVGGFWNKTGGHVIRWRWPAGWRAPRSVSVHDYARSPAISFERRNDKWMVRLRRRDLQAARWHGHQRL